MTALSSALVLLSDFPQQKATPFFHVFRTITLTSSPLPPPSFIEVDGWQTKIAYVRCTTWWVDRHTHCEMITIIIKLVNASVASHCYLVCVCVCVHTHIYTLSSFQVYSFFIQWLKVSPVWPHVSHSSLCQPLFWSLPPWLWLFEIPRICETMQYLSFFVCLIHFV